MPKRTLADAFPTLEGENSRANYEGDEVIPEAINLHSTLPTQTGAKSGKYITLQPRAALEKRGKIQFRITSGTNQFIDAGNTFICITTKICDENGNDIPLQIDNPDAAGQIHNPDANVIPVNGMSHAWFKQVNVKLNNVNITFDGDMYAHRGDIETRIGYPIDNKAYALDLAGYIEEGIAFEDVAVADLPFGGGVPGADIAAFMARFHRSKGSREFHTIGRIHTEICDQPKWLPPGSILDFEFERNDSNFLTLTKRDGSYTVEMVSCQMLAHIMEGDEEVTEDIEKTSEMGKSILYPLRRVHMMYYNRGPNTSDLSNYNLLLGETEILPRRIFVCMVKESAMHGNKGEDPFNYQPFNLSEFALKIGGHEVPYPKFDCDTRNIPDNENPRSVDNYLLPLFSLIQTLTGNQYGMQDIGVCVKNFKKRNFILGFDLTGAQIPAGECFEMSDAKHVELIMKLDDVVNCVVKVLVYVEYDAELELTPDNQVITHKYA